MSQHLRRTGAVIAGLALALGLTACGSDDDSDTASSEESWSYTSGNGDTIELDHKPERIIASAAEAAGLMAYGIKPVGIYLASDLQDEPGILQYDLDGIEIIGEEWGKMDAEKAAALKPDLIVADWWPAQDAYQGFEEGVDAASLKVAKLAPVIGANQQGSLEEVIDWYEGFAKTMDVDVSTGEYAAAHEKFNASKQAFKDAVAAKPGLSVLAVAPAEDMLYVAVPKLSTSLTDFQTWGMNVIEPDSPKDDFPYWEYLSWENADKYQADLLLLDDRGYTDNIAIGEAQPTWSKIAAGAAKAYAKWPGWWVHSYNDYATQLDALTAVVNVTDPDLAG